MFISLLAMTELRHIIAVAGTEGVTVFARVSVVAEDTTLGVTGLNVLGRTAWVVLGNTSNLGLLLLRISDNTSLCSEEVLL